MGGQVQVGDSHVMHTLKLLDHLGHWIMKAIIMSSHLPVLITAPLPAISLPFQIREHISPADDYAQFGSDRGQLINGHTPYKTIELIHVAEQLLDESCIHNFAFILTEICTAAGPLAFREILYKSGTHRIVQHIADGQHQVSVVLDQHGFETVLEHVAPAPVALPEISGVLTIQLLEKRGHFAVVVLKDHVVVGIHQAPGQYPQPGQFLNLLQYINKENSIPIIPKQDSPFVPPVHGMMKRPLKRPPR